MIIESGSKLVMIGDSITDCNRKRPIGEGLGDVYGNGYVNLVKGLMSTSYPERKIRIVNMGVSADTVRELNARWQTDVLDLEPDWLSVMIGINDVWRQHHTPLQNEIHVVLDEYRATLEELILRTKPMLKGLILMTPYYIEDRKEDAMRAMMDRYGAVVRELAEKYHAVFVDTQAAFDSMLKHCHSAALAWDRVHPSTVGHMVIAKAFLREIGYVF
jgi:lysophospholipase L1-like esterase